MGAQWKHAGRVDAANARGRVFSKLAKDIILAAKHGADLASNARLRLAVDAAKKASMPRDTIERSIKRGSGQLDDGAQFEHLTFEGFGPHQVPVIVECLTDNKNRTTTSVRVLFRKGHLGNHGSVSWDFRHLGVVEASPADKDAQDAETTAIEAGAQDVEPGDDGSSRFLTEPGDLDHVSKALSGLHWHVTSAGLAWRAKNPLTLDDAARAEVIAFLQAIDDDDDVQHVYAGLA